MRKCLQLCAVLSALIVSVATGQTPQPQEATLTVGSATIADLKGEVSVRPPQGQPAPAQHGQIVSPESIIEIGKGRAVLNLQDGSQVLINAHSRVLMKSPNEGRGSFLELLLGKVIARVQKRLGNAPSFKLGTPSAVITVRGTRFSVEVTKTEKTIVSVFEGLVDVAGLSMDTQPVQVRPGFWTEVERERPPIQPRGGQPGSMHHSDKGHDDVMTPGMRREPEEGGSAGSSGWSSKSEESNGTGHQSEQEHSLPSSQPREQTEQD